MSNQICPHCKQEVQAGLRFCTNCGMPIRTAPQNKPNTDKKTGWGQTTIRDDAKSGQTQQTVGSAWNSGGTLSGSNDAKPGTQIGSAWGSSQTGNTWGSGAQSGSAWSSAGTQTSGGWASTAKPSSTASGHTGVGTGGSAFGGSANTPVPPVFPGSETTTAAADQTPDEPQEKTCPSCGKPVQPGTGFCPHCGASLTGTGGGKSKLPLYIGIAVAALALVAVVIAAIVTNRNKKNESKPSNITLDFGETEQQPQQDTGFGTGTVVDQPTDFDTETPTQTETETEPGLTADEASTLAADVYQCDVMLLSQDAQGYDLLCQRNGHELGTLRVDRDGTITVLSGMTSSNILNLDTDTINGYFSGKVSYGNYGYAIIDLNTGEMVGENQDSAMSSSVIIDVPILYAVARELENGGISMDSSVPVVSGKSARGSLSQYAGKTLTVSTMLDKMFGDSSGDAACSLMDYIGMERINSICHDAGYPSVQVRNYIGKSGIDYTDRDNVVSAGDVCGMLDELYNGDNAYINAYFLENNMHMRNSQDYSNNGLGKSISGGLRGYFNGIKSDKYNEVILVNDDNGHCFAICFLGCRTDDGTLMKIANKVGSYVNDVMRR